MQQCYADNATFNDPVFTNLNATQVRAMWEMFCVKSRDLKIEFGNIHATEKKGSASWVATYLFSSTVKKVVNHITAHFTFENGKIKQHTDAFNFYKWCKQALGVTGLLLGWTPLIKNKVRHKGMKALNEYMLKK